MPTTKKNIWSKLAMSFSLLAIIFSILFISLFGMPMGIAFAVFSITFAINNKQETGNFSSANILAITFSILAIIISIIFFFLSLKLLEIMNDPIKANIYIQNLKDFISQLPPAWQTKLNELYGF